MHWQIHEAKQQFSQLVRMAIEDGPRIVTRKGNEVAVVISIEQYRHLTGDPTGFKEFLMSFPNVEGFEIERSRDPGRVVEL